jgi:hypothetical protein
MTTATLEAKVTETKAILDDLQAQFDATREAREAGDDTEAKRIYPLLRKAKRDHQEAVKDLDQANAWNKQVVR